MQKVEDSREINMSCKQFIDAVAFCLLCKDDWEGKLGKSPINGDKKNLSFVYHCLLRCIYLRQKDSPTILGIIRDLFSCNIIIARAPDEIQTVEKIMIESEGLKYFEKAERLQLFYEIEAYTEKFDVDRVKFSSVNHIESSGAFFLISSAFNSYSRKKSFDRLK